jgi:hypothetical protein
MKTFLIIGILDFVVLTFLGFSHLKKLKYEVKNIPNYDLEAETRFRRLCFVLPFSMTYGLIVLYFIEYVLSSYH